MGVIHQNFIEREIQKKCIGEVSFTSFFNGYCLFVLTGVCEETHNA